MTTANPAKTKTRTKKLKHNFEPRGAAKELFESKASEVLLSGPAGTGKSRACLEKLHLLALLVPGMRGLIVRKTLTSLGSTALVTWREQVIVEALQAGDVQYYGGSMAEAAQYRYSNGSVITLGGLDKASRVMSSEYDVIYVQEAIELTEDDWEALTTRLRNWKVPYQQLMADTNPSHPTHWLKLRCNVGKTVLLESRHEDNPRLVKSDGTRTTLGETYIASLEALTGPRYLRLRKGLWTAAEGVIFEDFDTAVHIIDKLPRKFDYFYWSVDFGYTNPFVWQAWGVLDQNLYLVKEIYHTKRLVAEMAKQIQGLHMPRPRALICDHDAEGRATLERELKMSTIAARKKVLEGIQAVQRRFKNNSIKLYRAASVGRDPDLLEAKKPTSTIEEIPGYIWADSKVKEAPVKEDDHGCDAMRYVVAQRDLRSRPGIRWL